MANAAATGDIPATRKRRKVAQDGLPGFQADKRSLYHCNYCKRDLSNLVRIKCAICTDFDLCCECFSVGVELTPHRCWHAYRVVHCLNVPLYAVAWGADEELLLLEALDQYGIGNWQAVSEHVGSKTKDECMQHYLSVYIESATSPLPQRLSAADAAAAGPLLRSPTHTPIRPPHSSQAGKTLPKIASTNSTAAAAESATQHAADVKREDSDQLAKPTGEEHGSKRARVGQKSGGAASKQPKPESSGGAAAAPAQQQTDHRTIHATPPDVTVSAAVLAGDKDLTKIGEMAGYNAKRHEFDPEYDQDAELPIADIEFREDESEEDRAAKLRMLHIYNARLNEREKRRNLILKLGLLDIKELQKADKKRNALERAMHARLRVFKRHADISNGDDGACGYDAWVDGLATEAMLRSRIEELKTLHRCGIRSLPAAEQAMTTRGGRLRATTSSDDRGATVSSAHPQFDSTPASTSGVAGDSGSRAAGIARWRRARGAAIDITSLPDTQLLSQRERSLCAHAGILPCHYLAMKAAMMTANSSSGGNAMLLSHDNNLPHERSHKGGKVVELLNSCGWLHSSAVHATHNHDRHSFG